MNLRWVVYKNFVTAEDVLKERECTGDSLMLCKARLVAENKPVLQIMVNGEWETNSFKIIDLCC